MFFLYSLGQAWVPIRKAVPVPSLPQGSQDGSQQEHQALSSDNVPGFEEPLFAPPVETGPCPLSTADEELTKLIQEQFDRSMKEGETGLNYAISCQEWFWGKTAFAIF